MKKLLLLFVVSTFSTSRCFSQEKPVFYLKAGDTVSRLCQDNRLFSLTKQEFLVLCEARNVFIEPQPESDSALIAVTYGTYDADTIRNNVTKALFIKHGDYWERAMILYDHVIKNVKFGDDNGVPIVRLDIYREKINGRLFSAGNWLLKRNLEGGWMHIRTFLPEQKPASQ